MAAVVVLYKFAFFLIFFRSRRSGRCFGVESTLVRDSVKIDIRLLTETKKDDDETKESLLAVLRLLSIFYVKITHTAYLHTTSVYVH